MQFCRNRPEGFGTLSAISSPLPTQCFFDTILVPLPTWLLLVSLALLPLVFRRSLTGGRSASRTRWVRIVLPGVYYFSIGAICLMESVEVFRLVQADLGLGLVPFAYGGCLVALVTQATDGLAARLRGWQVANMLFWAASAAVTALKVVALVRFGMDGPLARDDTAYPVEHQFTDLVVLAAFYGLLVVLETALLYLRPGRKTVVENTGTVVDKWSPRG